MNVLKLHDFSTNFMLHCSIRSRPSTHQVFFFKFYIKCTVTDDITRVIGTNTAINGVRLALSFRDLSTNITRS